MGVPTSRVTSGRSGRQVIGRRYSRIVSRFTLLLGLAAVLVAGCESGGADTSVTTARPEPTTTTVAIGGASPTDAVTLWLDALTIERFDLADQVVVADQFVLLVAVESYSVDVYRDLLDNGVSPAVSRNFWASFVSGLRGFTGATITEVAVEAERRFAAYGSDYAEVGLTSPLGSASVVTRLESDGRWYVDLLATFGPGFAPLFNLWLERLPPDQIDPQEALIAERPSLMVARDRLEGAADAETIGEVERLLDALG